ncbi:methylamine utilization protein MauJ [Delftia tsuruhatensis]|uniref:methylamine utilization protein MauJ n=2 Tax=Comamonadaceae TaxID=80864 RepID=UPI0039BD2A2D
MLSVMKHGPYIVHEFGTDAESHYSAMRGWLTAACYTSIAWPESDVRLNYDGDDYFLRGAQIRNGRRDTPGITMRCQRGQESEVMGKILRFASILGWFKRGYVDVGGYVAGSHANLYSEGQGQSTMIACGPHGFECNYLPLIRDERTRRALAFWREGLRLRQIHVGYAFLSFFKVIESQFDRSALRVAWIAEALPVLEGDAGARVRALSSEVADVGKHIYDSGRCAVAHAQFADGRGDPDVPEDRRRLEQDLTVMEALARQYIAYELGVPDEMVVHRDRDRLEAVAQFVPEPVARALREKVHVSRRSVGLQGLIVGLARWPQAPVATFSSLSLRVREVQGGKLFITASNPSDSITLGFVLDFSENRAHVILGQLNYRLSDNPMSTDDAIAVVDLRKNIIGNALLELWLPNGERLDFEVFIPVNIDIAATWKSMDAEIAMLRKKTHKRTPPVSRT